MILFKNIKGESVGIVSKLTYCPRIGEYIICPFYSKDNVLIGTEPIKVSNIIHNVRFDNIEITLDTEVKYDLFKGI